MQRLFFVMFCFATLHYTVGGNETSIKQETTHPTHSAISDEDIVIVHETDSYGKQLPNASGSRIRRETNLASKHFTLQGFGQNFLLELQPTKVMISPGFKVYHRQNFQTVKEDVLVDRKLECLYTGRSKNHEGSVVAVNVCNGLTGLIKASNEEYLIQPISNKMGSSMKHILQKRSLPSGDTGHKKGQKKYKKGQTHYCGRKRKYMPSRPPKRNHWLPGEFDADHLEREKRSIEQDQPRNVETLVVADRDMVYKHGIENVTTYVLTIFNMVAMLYQDPTIGHNISVILVGLVLLEGDEPGLTLSHSAEQSLSSFCQWQSTIRTSKGTQHDHAVLVTGKDICSFKEGPCDTLGYAPISGMCSKYRSCTINEDSGLALAFTIAHEIGHNFGMVHDGQSHSSCRAVRGTIMSPSLSGLDSGFLWSACSQRELHNFLRSPKSRCLNNIPDSPGQLKFPDILPGQLYDGNMQCLFQFGTKSKLCRHYVMTKEICKALWCENGRKCETKFLPAAEGTLCGKNKWCRKGSCIDQESESIVPVHGGWSAFSNWSICSVECGGGGLKQRERYCDSPSPKNGGMYCKGRSKEHSMCSMQECSFERTVQQQDHCAIFNERTVKGKQYQWKPYSKDLGALARCRIYCAPDKKDLYLVLSTKLPDGTSCQGNHSSVCVNGECRPVGCDGKVDSDVVPDLCGVCNGDNSTCRTVSGMFVVANLSRSYRKVIEIPAGSRHINVSESKDYPTYLSLKNSEGKYYLNGNWAINWPGRYMASDNVISYQRWPGKSESIVTKGPTNEKLIAEVIVQEGQTAEIFYNFVVSLSEDKWKFFNSSCSTSCGNGVIQSIPKCVNALYNINGSYCKSTKPPNKVFTCYNDCPAKWETFPWSECPFSSCNKPSWKIREVVCKLNKARVDPSLCQHGKRPQSKQACPLNKCFGVWITHPWQKCHGECPYGVQKRLVLCKETAHASPTNNDICDPKLRPAVSRPCGKRVCSLKSNQATWVTSQWSTCSVTCGQGIQIRNVTCMSSRFGDSKGSSLSGSCDLKTRPKSSHPCTSTACKTNKKQDCRDKEEWCRRVANSQLCQLAYYNRNCCRSCHELL